MKTLKISEVAHEYLTAIKKEVSYSTYNDAIIGVWEFFNRNKVSPRDTINSNFFSVLSMLKSELKNDILEVKKWQAKDSQSLRKLYRGLEKDYMVSNATKLAYLYEKEKEKELQKTTNETFQTTTPENNDKSKNIDKTEVSTKAVENDILEAKDTTITQLETLLDKQDILYKDHKKMLKKVYQNVTIEKSTFGKKRIVIDMEETEFYTIFEVL